MRTKDEILKPIKELCEGVANDPEAAWHGYVEHAKLEALLDIRNILDELTIAVQNIATLRLTK